MQDGVYLNSVIRILGVVSTYRSRFINHKFLYGLEVRSITQYNLHSLFHQTEYEMENELEEIKKHNSCRRHPVVPIILQTV